MLKWKSKILKLDFLQSQTKHDKLKIVLSLFTPSPDDRALRSCIANYGAFCMQCIFLTKATRSCNYNRLTSNPPLVKYVRFIRHLGKSAKRQLMALTLRVQTSLCAASDRGTNIQDTSIESERTGNANKRFDEQIFADTKFLENCTLCAFFPPREQVSGYPSSRKTVCCSILFPNARSSASLCASRAANLPRWLRPLFNDAHRSPEGCWLIKILKF